jgi:predicted AlkP superfamily pyrophosphatase or phosphodiesterase
MHRTLVLNVVGLTPALLGNNTPHLSAFVAQGGLRPLATITPAVTCSVQATLLTGSLPREHGIVANGWYVRELAEVMFWRQSNQLVSGEKVWEAGKRRDPSFRCAKLFWWYNMYSSADLSVTPRPMYPADGRKLPDVYAEPEQLRADLQRKLGTFPLFQFWGPGADIVSSEWIARAAEHVEQEHAPTLSLVYLPHLDYCLQKFGPDAPEIAAQLRAVDAICGRLIEAAARRGQRVIVLSEYGIEAVTDAVHLNRALREAGLLRVREELGRELLDAGASQAFAVADHQLAHVYVRDAARVEEVQRLLARLDGVEQVLDAEGKRGLGLDHPRSGELVAISRPDRWFSYYYWLDDARAPDFARTVEIHRKPGYDPLELFLDPALAFPKLRIARKLLLRKLGQRSLLDVIPLDARLVRGSHGRVGRAGERPERGPLFASSAPELLPAGQIAATQVKELMLAHVFGPAGAPR